uniref:HVA22-like protein n=1 Tax=Opuntia streptacantha TaxID=393608 RepID=A0A7C9D175_OPUST
MIGNFLTRGLVMLFGYAYPAYECFKTVEKNKPDVEELRFWCQYWILVAMLTIFERVGDNFISWIPMYSEAKLAFVIFLWYPKTKGTTYVYDSFFRPYMAKHETEIDRNLLELRARAGEVAVAYCQKAASYGQSRVFEVLQYIAARSTPRPSRAQRPPRAHQRPEAAAAAHQPPSATRQPSIRSQTSQLQNEEPASTTTSASSIQQEKDVGPETSSTKGPSTSAPAALAPAAAPLLDATTAIAPVKKSMSLPAAPGTSSQSPTNGLEEVEKGLPHAPVPPEETGMEEAIRVTRARLRKTQSEVNK